MPTPVEATATQVGVPTSPLANGNHGIGGRQPIGDSRNQPTFSDVANRPPEEIVSYLLGRLPEFTGTGAHSIVDFSASDILETMDTALLDRVRLSKGDGALQQVIEIVSRAITATLKEQYGDSWLLVPLDAGHGGKKGVSWDPGAAGSEAEYNRAVADALLRLARSEQNSRIIFRPIYNDSIDDELGLPSDVRKPLVDRILIRQVRASMLATEAERWNRSVPGARVAVHEISVHFNAGAHSALVLHQGDSVQRDFVMRSAEFGRRYLTRVVADLEASLLLPEKLPLWAGTGLHDDEMMYRPDYLSDADISGIKVRYGALQGQSYLSRYAESAIAYFKSHSALPQP